MALSGGRTWIVAALVVALAAAGAVAWNWRGANNANFPDGTNWICSSPTCGHEFTLTMAELSAHHARHYGEPVPCPKCGQPAIRAAKCPHCGKIYPLQRNGGACPACGKPPAE